MKVKPWDVNSDLTKERIVAISNLIATVRGEVIDLHDQNLGDTPLSLGTRAYECCRTRIIQTASQKVHSWLDILTYEGRFTFRIGNTPVRFTRNDPKSLPDRKMVVSPEARRQLSFFENDLSAELRWFIVFDTYHKSPADNVYCVGYDKFKNIVAQWDVPIDGSVPMLSSQKDDLPKAVKIEEPTVKLKSVKGKKVVDNE